MRSAPLWPGGAAASGAYSTSAMMILGHAKQMLQLVAEVKELTAAAVFARA